MEGQYPLLESLLDNQIINEDLQDPELNELLIYGDEIINESLIILRDYIKENMNLFIADSLEEIHENIVNFTSSYYQGMLYNVLDLFNE